MLKKLLAIGLIVAPFLLNAQVKPQLIKLGRLEQAINGKTDTLQVINFWATWCAPCVKELPLFEKINQQGTLRVRVTLVSMDLSLDPNPDKVYKFVSRKQLSSRVWILDERDPNTYIDKIDPSWSGALPATLVVNTVTGKRKFVEGEMSEEKLNQLISEIQ
jgi:thiol-disulfide isomerase/thioredoxin